MDRKARYMPVWGRYVDMFMSDELTNAQVGMLFRAMLQYYFDGILPEDLSKQLRGFWYFLRMDLNDAQSRYDLMVQGGQKGGQKSARARKAKEQSTAEVPEQTDEDIQQEKAGDLNPCQPLHTPTEPSASLPKGQVPLTRTRTESRTGTESRSINDYICQYISDENSEKMNGNKKRYGEYGWVELADHQYRKLQALMGKDTLERCIDYLDQSAQSTHNRNNWKDWYVLIRRCHEGKWYVSRQRSSNKDIPQGACGELGEAELEAIRSILAQEPPSASAGYQGGI